MLLLQMYSYNNLFFFWKQASVIHQDFLRFIHVDDHEIVKKNLQPYSEDEEEQVFYKLNKPWKYHHQD